MESSSPARLDWIDYLKGLAILFVVFGHMPFADGLANPGRTVAYSFHMPLFFLLSGYTAALSYSRRPHALPFVGRRFLSLMVPHIVWGAFGTLFLLSGMLFGGTDVSASFKALIAGYGQWWFLPCMFIMQILFLGAMCVKSCLKFKGSLLLGFVLVVGATFACNSILSPFTFHEFGMQIGYLVRLHCLVWPFALGCAMYMYKPFMDYVLRSEWLAFAAIVGYLVSCNYGIGGMALSGTAAGILLIRCFSRISPQAANENTLAGFSLRMLKCFGASSLAIYVTAWIFQSVLIPLCSQDVPQILVFATNMVMSVLICYLCVAVKKLINCSSTASLLFFGEFPKKVQAKP